MSQHETVSADPLLRISDLAVHFQVGERPVRVLDGVSLEIERGESFGMLGETGAGKSLSAWATMGLLPFGAEIVSGAIEFDGHDLRTAPPDELRALRGRELAIVLQNPKAALTPTARIGAQMANAYRAHVACGKDEAWERAVEGLRQVGIPDPSRRARAYPHELSIGMAQRVVIAIALLHEPKLLIADEPTSALDVTIQAEVLDLLRGLVSQTGAALWLITHDLGVIASYCDRAAVMFAGEVVENCSVKALFESPRHPYVKGLLDSRLVGDGSARLDIAGPPPDLTQDVQGCRFAYRCPWVEPRCLERPPELREVAPGHPTRCWVAQDAADKGGAGKPGGGPSTAEASL